jgi:hypothetical protein
MGVLSLMGSDFKEKLGPMVPGAHIVSLCLLLPLPTQVKVPIVWISLCRASS